MSSFLILSKTTESCRAAQRFLQARSAEVTLAEGERGSPLPAVAQAWEGDYLISFVSSWIVPESLLARARVAALNFHPAPPEYPGIGCYNFALYENAATYGVTCHHMVRRVDSGKIVKVLRFPVEGHDTVATLKERSMTALFELYCDVLSGILEGEPLPASAEEWTRRPFTRKELDALCRVTPDMPAEEIRRRARATYFPGFLSAYVELAGLQFQVTSAFPAAPAA